MIETGVWVSLSPSRLWTASTRAGGPSSSSAQSTLPASGPRWSSIVPIQGETILKSLCPVTLASACRSTINKRQRLIVVLPPNTVNWIQNLGGYWDECLNLFGSLSLLVDLLWNRVSWKIIFSTERTLPWISRKMRHIMKIICSSGGIICQMFHTFLFHLP